MKRRETKISRSLFLLIDRAFCDIRPSGASHFPQKKIRGRLHSLVAVDISRGMYTIFFNQGMTPRLPLIALLLAALALVFVKDVNAAEDSAEYKPTGDVYSMQMHFNWCGEAKTPAERLKRYEKFWELQSPKESDGYDDSLHVRTVRRCGYRLAQLYAELGRKKDCLKMIAWLEEEDDSFDVERE